MGEVACDVGQVKVNDRARLMRRVYIVLSTTGVGGAEKRFVDNWHQLLTSEGLDIHLVIDRRTYEGLAEQAGYVEKLACRTELHVIDLGDQQFQSFCRATWNFFETQPRGVVMHYPLAHVPGLQTRFGHRLIMSWVNSAMPPLVGGRWKIGVGAWAGLLTADHVDVLNPSNLKKIRMFPGMSKKVTLTAGGTQVDNSVYRPLPKARDLVFLGRAEPEKQCLRFVECLPELDQMLKAAGHSGYRFVVCGDGREVDAIRVLSRTNAFQNFPFEFGYSAKPESVLGHAAVYFSLQRTSNYPSKALAEAMACGAYPILTNVGESSLMVDGCNHYQFVPREFIANDLFNSLDKYFSLSPQQVDSVVRENAEFANWRFASGQQIKYFAEIYRSVGAAE